MRDNKRWLHVNNAGTFIALFNVLVPHTILAQEVTDEQDKPVAKLVEEIKCENDNKIQIFNYEYSNKAKNITKTKTGEFLNVWVAYREAYYYGEANVYYLINKNTCKKYPIDGENLVFFDINTFLTWSWDFEAEYFPNQISIFNINNDVVKKLSEFIPEEGGPSDAVWVDRNRIKFKLVQFNPDQNSDVVYVFTDKIIVKHNDKWVYE